MAGGEGKENPELKEKTERLSQALAPIVNWYRENRRILPWREMPEPYRVWVSEIMLQQTRVETVIPYYQRFLEALPSAAALARAPEEQLLTLWRGLGYYNRVRSMKKAAQIIEKQFGGKLPGNIETLRTLPGFGRYTAGAVASIAFGAAVPAVDGNVMRVVSRLLSEDRNIGEASAVKYFENLVAPCIPADTPGEFNQALMDLGALICLPGARARCSDCPLASRCAAFRRGEQEKFPVKNKKTQRRVEEKTVLLLLCADIPALRRRPEKGLLAGMWELPWQEGKKNGEEMTEWCRDMGIEVFEMEPLPEYVHRFTHVEWHMIGFRAEIRKETRLPEGWVWGDPEKTRREMAIPSAFTPFLKAVSGRKQLQ